MKAQQLNFFAKPLNLVATPKCTWDKFYSVYKVDYTFYHKLFEDVKKKPEFPCFIIKLLNLNFIFYYITYSIVCNSLNVFEKDKLRDFCYIRNENGQKEHCGDIRHIYRYKTFLSIREKLINFISTDDFQKILNSPEQSIVIDQGLYTIYAEKYLPEQYYYRDMVNTSRNPRGATFKGQKFEVFEVEINNTWNLPLKQRIELHIKLLKKLREGRSFEEALQTVLNKKEKG